MTFDFQVSARMSKPVAEVYQAVVNPKQLSAYFTTIGGASHPLVAGTTVLWWNQTPVEVIEVVENARIVLRWNPDSSTGNQPYKTLIDMLFIPLDDGGTLVKIGETGWEQSDAGQKASYVNCEGWTQMLCSMKAWLEYGINLRSGYFQSEMQGKPASQINHSTN
ncbi:ATPase [Chania multitudinisentens RB-25]|uniref:ATPase n=1 Tax=Chania multitudinisentens RB-25 TaxID=1441930 RepID=W0L9G4_9GAMM|nr:SRPBCC domain-containing protein [Chania multitudinisentens]AHG18655.1 ATPase [Chania multitudinisentens RB-25]